MQHRTTSRAKAARLEGVSHSVPLKTKRMMKMLFIVVP